MIRELKRIRDCPDILLPPSPVYWLNWAREMATLAQSIQCWRDESDQSWVIEAVFPFVFPIKGAR